MHLKTSRSSYPASNCLKRRLSIKSTRCVISACTDCYEFSSDLASCLSKVKAGKDGEAAQVSYLHNAQGQRVFKSEPKAEQYQPNEEELGTEFVTWLKKNFSWMFAQAQSNASIGTAYTFADPSTGTGQAGLPEWAVLGEYDNGSAKGAGRTEYIWLPTDDSSAMPVGIYRNGKFFAIHSDHLGTPRLMTDEQNVPVWQWPYSAFGNNKPTGILKATPNPRAAITNNPVLLRATAATEMNLRFPGQYADEEAGQFYNYFRNYQPNQGRFTQADPIGMDGGLNRFGYVDANPLAMIDPLGLQAATAAGSAGGLGGLGGAAGGSRGGYDPRTDTFTPIPNISIPSFLKSDECSPENNCNKLNDDVQRAKDKVGKFQPAACSSGMSKLDLLARSSAWLELAVARAKRDQKCWAGGDAGHQQAQADAWANLGRCQRLLR